MVIRVRDLLGRLDAIAPFAQAADWDPVGLQIGRRDGDAASIGVVHELTESVTNRCIEAGLDTVVTYHPVVFRPLGSLTDKPGAEGRALRLASAGIAVISVHTNWDVAPGGTADALAGALGLTAIEGFGPAGDVDDGRYIGRIGVAAGDLSDLVGLVGQELGGAVRSTPGPDQVAKVAVVPGSGGSFVGDAAAGGADVLVTGDISHHTAQEALDHGMAVIDPGHIATERPGVRALYAAVSEIGVAVADLTDLEVSPWEGR